MITISLGKGLNVNLNLLETFLLVAEHGSFTAAAARLGRSVSAVSSQVKQLEDQLDLPLFERTTRLVVLTEHGELLRQGVRSGVEEIKHGLIQLQKSREKIFKNIFILCSASLAWQLVPSIITKFKSQERDVEVDVLEMSSLKMAGPLLSGDAAFGVGAIDYSDDALLYEPIISDPFVALIPKTMPQSRLSSISLQELVELGIILPPEVSMTRRVLEAAFQRWGVMPRVAFEGVAFHTALAMVEAGQGVSAFPSMTSRMYQGVSLRRVPVRDHGVVTEYGIIQVKGRQLTRHQEKLLELVRRELRDWKPEPHPPHQA